MKKMIVSTFVTLAAVVLGSTLPAFADHHGDAGRQFYEIRTYTFETNAQRGVTEDYWEKAAIPALKRLGVGPVGVFREFDPEESLETPRLVVLITYSSVEQFASITYKLNEDAAYLKAGAAYLKAPKDSPAYSRIQSDLVHAFAAMPELAAPATNKDRIFELREYEGHIEYASHVKVQMFEDIEVEVFAKTSLSSVFFGKTLIGQNRPSLIYMLTFDDLEDKDRDWEYFVESDLWGQVSNDPKWADGGVSHVTSTMLRPMYFSEI